MEQVAQRSYGCPIPGSVKARLDEALSKLERSAPALLSYGDALPMPGSAQQGVLYAAEGVALFFLCKDQIYPGKIQQ